MEPSTIFVIGVVTVGLMLLFIYESFHLVRKSERTQRHARRTSAPPSPPPQPAGPMRILVATDGSPCSDTAVLGVAARPWPEGSAVHVVTVVHTRVPELPDPVLVGAAAHVTALAEDREQAPRRVARAAQQLAGRDDLVVDTSILEGDPERAILEEAERWDADLLVVGSHGYGPVRRLALGSVSRGVAAHASCSVEIVRCPAPRDTP